MPSPPFRREEVARRQNSLKLTSRRVKRIPSQTMGSAPRSSGLKRICSDTLCPRSPVADDVNSIVQGSVSPKTQQSPAKMVAAVSVGIGARRSSDPDLSTPPKAALSSSAGTGGGKFPVHRPAVNQESLDMLEYPFITMKSFPAHVVQHLGGVVSARSVKLLDQINNPDDPETRDAWWTELRKEIRSHTRALGCNVVLGYTEMTSFCDDICVLSASGTAAILCQSADHDFPSAAPGILSHSSSSRPSSGERTEKDMSAEAKNKPLSIDVNLANHPGKVQTDWTDDIANSLVCSLCHIPYSESSVPFSNLVLCAICRRSKVPDVLFMTIEPPPGIPVTGKGCFIQSRVFRLKRESKGEQNAKDISDSLPFLEYELHKQLLTKLKVKGMNGLFGLRVQVSVGERMLIGVATGTGAYLSALPPPNAPIITCAKGAGEARICELQKLVQETIAHNKECYDLLGTVSVDNNQDNQVNGKVDDGELSEEDLPEIDLSVGNKDTFILEVDDTDVDILSLLNDPKPPEGFELCNTEKLPGVDNYACNIQMFTRVYRTRLSCLGQSNRQVAQHFEYFLQSLFVKLRKMTPCCISSLHFNVELPDQDEMQISAYGIAVGLGDPGLSLSSGRSARPRVKHNSLPHVGLEPDPELLFSIDDDRQGPSHLSQEKCGFRSPSGIPTSQSAEGRFHYHSPFREQSGIELTPLSFVPGGRIEHYLGNLDFFFIRECTSIRENGGLNGFLQTFISEVLAIARAHVAALGGNAMVAFQKTHCILFYNPHKNQGQCLMNVAGDAVSVLYSTLHHSSGSETQYSEGE